jgi:hypothetical protein
MKSLVKCIVLIVGFFSIESCQDVVEVDLDTTEPKLVIDANIKWQKGMAGNEQTIRLSTTTNFYSNAVPNASGGTVTVTNSRNTVFNFNEKLGASEYICTDFVPEINEIYTLKVIYKGQVYSSTEKFYNTPKIEGVEQKNLPGFTGEEFIQFKFFYQDNGAENNFYLVGFVNDKKKFPEYGVVDDEFFQGNQMFGFYGSDDIKAEDKLAYSLQSISERQFNYMNKLLNIAGNGGGGPFSTPPATLRGNIVNQTDDKNFPFGYFNLSEIDTGIYTIK